MGYTWKQRFINWICRTFGHRQDKRNTWDYKGINTVCKRCHICYKLSEE